MNDFERKLAAQAFREPPSDLRRTILAACEPMPRASWREWLWPSPTAWGALAAVWLVFLGLYLTAERQPAAAPFASRPAGNVPNPGMLLTLHTEHDLRHALDPVR